MTPRCSAGCGAPAAYEVLRADGESFKPQILTCEHAARAHNPRRRLSPEEFGLPASRSAPDPASMTSVPAVVGRASVPERFERPDISPGVPVAPSVQGVGRGDRTSAAAVLVGTGTVAAPPAHPSPLPRRTNRRSSVAAPQP